MNYKKAYKTDSGKEKVLNVYDEILKAWPVVYEEIYVNTKYGNTHIIQCGDKGLPPLILLHGTSTNSTMWIGDVEKLSKDYCLYLVDILGEPGKSEEKQYLLKENIYFEWLNEIVDILKLERVSIVAISLGAWLSLGYAIKYSEKVEKLVLLCPSGIGKQRVSFMLKAFPLMLLGKYGMDKISIIVNGGTSVPKKAVEYSQLIAKNFNLRTETVPIYSDEELKKLNIPLLLFAGENDALLDSKETIKRISKLLPNAKTTLLVGYGHVLIGLQDKILKFLLEDQ